MHLKCEKLLSKTLLLLSLSQYVFSFKSCTLEFGEAQNSGEDVPFNNSSFLHTSKSEIWPKNVTMQRLTSTSVKIIWRVKDDEKFKWYLEYSPAHAKYRVMREISTSVGCMILESLLPNTHYHARLIAMVNNVTIVHTSPTYSFSTETPISLAESNSVRAEEIGIVLLVLLFWMFAIVLFFNRWGKIRMLEPYQEPYKEQPIHSHRASCPGLVEPCLMSKRNSMMQFRLMDGHQYMSPPSSRPRLGSLAVGRSYSLSQEMPPRRVRSAVNLTSLVLHECDEEASNSNHNTTINSNHPSTSVGSMTTAV
ncbi:UNVERIFIED_CONTAM: hypothetical protein RMT77_003634 [Armadillidium vulgare]